MDQAGFFDIMSFVLSSSAVYFHKSYPFSRPQHSNFKQRLVFARSARWDVLCNLYFIPRHLRQKGPVTVMESKYVQPFL